MPSTITREAFGEFDSRTVERYTLSNANGMRLSVITWGAVVTELWAKGADGSFADVVAGLDDMAAYAAAGVFFGATCGRVANRICDARFTLGDKTYQLAANDPPHHLHGGPNGWDRAVWSCEPLHQEGALRLTHVSPDGDEGYPGQVTAVTTYTLTDDDEFVVEMQATTDAPTVVNMAHHTYWNLAGHAGGTIEGHRLELHSDEYTPGTPVVPDGRVWPVAGTAFDFSRPKLVGQDISETGAQPPGYDHNFVVRGEATAMRPVARLSDPESGRVLTLDSNQPGVQLYTGNFLDGTLVGKGTRYIHRAGMCLETQAFPNAINVPEWRPQVELLPGATYHHVMRHRFSVEG